MPIAHRTNWTVDEVHAIPEDGNRYEVIDGELVVSPAPSSVHQDAVLELATRLHAYVRELRLHLFIAPSDVKWSDHTLVQPDIFVLPRRADGSRATSFADVGRLILAVEVLSPSTARADRFTKRREYQKRGVPEYWIVDTDSRSIERWTPDDEEPEYFYETIDWQPDAATPPLTIDLVSFFREVHGE